MGKAVARLSLPAHELGATQTCRCLAARLATTGATASGARQEGRGWEEVAGRGRRANDAGWPVSRPSRPADRPSDPPRHRRRCSPTALALSSRAAISHGFNPLKFPPTAPDCRRRSCLLHAKLNHATTSHRRSSAGAPPSPTTPLRRCRRLFFHLCLFDRDA